MAEIPVISNHILHGLPAFIRCEIGERALQQANRAIGFDLELTEGENCFIPHAAVLGFVDATARAASDYGYRTTVVQDACATRDLEHEGVTVPAASVHAAMMSALGFAYATITDTDSYVQQ